MGIYSIFVGLLLVFRSTSAQIIVSIGLWRILMDLYDQYSLSVCARVFIEEEQEIYVVDGRKHQHLLVWNNSLSFTAYDW